jgi:hypothetical protein
VFREPGFHGHHGGGVGEDTRPPQPPPATGLDAIIEALEELQLSVVGVHAPERDQFLDFDFGKLERQLAVYLGPNRSREDLRALTFSFANVMT